MGDLKALVRYTLFFLPIKSQQFMIYLLCNTEFQDLYSTCTLYMLQVKIKPWLTLNFLCVLALFIHELGQ